MEPYQAPLSDMEFLLDKVFKLPQSWRDSSNFSSTIDHETARLMLQEAAKLTKDALKGINAAGDIKGAELAARKVITPDGYKRAFNSLTEMGWCGINGDTDYEGLGLPRTMAVMFDEMSFACCPALSLYLSLTAGAAHCLAQYGSNALKEKYLSALYSGSLTASMAMTEANSGSDLSNILTKATPMDDGSYLISGTKLFITAGDHDLTENIIHLVLAKIEGSDGISLFIVPKYTSETQFTPDTFNHVNTLSLEKKMGLKGSATCMLEFEQSKGWLLGRANRGLIYMLSMMNYERLTVAVQALGAADYAYQLADKYAYERVQGHLTYSQQPVVIAKHGDVQRMLLNCAAIIEPSRALIMQTADYWDQAVNKNLTRDASAIARNYAELLTPVAKAFISDRCMEALLTCQQVFGGYGYIHETGIEQLIRDTRITQIYEGTNGILAIDFVSRRILSDKLKTLILFIDDIKQQLCSFNEKKKAHQLIDYLDCLLTTATKLQLIKDANPDSINACAVDYLSAFGYVLYGYFWLAIINACDDSCNKEFVDNKNKLANWYFSRILPKAGLSLDLVEQEFIAL